MGSIAIAGNIVAAATALAGLILVYLGSINASYNSFTSEQQSAVKSQHRWKAWLAFIGLVVALIAAALAMAGEWTGCLSYVSWALALLAVSFMWAIISALLTVLEIA